MSNKNNQPTYNEKFFFSQRYLPLFITQFFGAFSDNVLKNAIVILITYSVATNSGAEPTLLVTATAGIFILPFFLFSAVAGQLADKYERSLLVRWIKFAEIILMALAAVALYIGNTWFLLVVLFGMSTQSTFFGPIKYSLLPQHLRPNELLSGNAYFEGATFIAILLGTLVGGILVMQISGTFLVALVLLLSAIVGYASARFVPVAPGGDPKLKINKNFLQETVNVIKMSAENKEVFRYILLISWLWLYGSVVLAQLPPFVKGKLYSDETVVTFLLTLFSVGVAIGSVLCAKVLKGNIKSTFVPLGGLGMSIFLLDIAHISSRFQGADQLFSITQFFTQPHSIRLSVDMLLLSIAAGLFIVPLYALMQKKAESSVMSRTIAANNIVNSFVMVIGAVVAMILYVLGFDVLQLFFLLGVVNLIMTVYLAITLQDSFIYYFIKPKSSK